MRSIVGKTLSLAMTVLVIAGGMAGCATLQPNRPERVQTLWEAREQYVAIEQQDQAAGKTVPANAHPADIPVERLRSVLESIEVRFPDRDKSMPLFKDPELKILSEQIREGLLSASPRQDVTFAVIGQFPALLGLLHERKLTTGRVFSVDGELNIIFGDLLRDLKDNEDRRLHPFRSASRAVAGGGNVVISRRPDGELFSVKRMDWLAFPLAARAAAPVTPAARPASPKPDEKAAPPAVPPGKPAITGKTSIQERLQTLHDLWQRKLVTDEEYRAKRREILNEL